MKPFRKVVMGVGACLLLAGLVSVVGVRPAGAVIAANGTISCKTVKGTVKFSPALETTGDANTDTATTTGTISGCKYTSTNIGSGTVTGTFTSKKVTTTSNNTANQCTTENITSQSYTLKWKDSNGDALGPSTITFSGFDVVFNGTGTAAYPGSDFPQDSGGTSSVGLGGSFRGTDGGASSTTNSYLTITVGTFLGSTKCGNATTDGVASIGIGHAGTTADPSEFIVG